MGTAQTRMNKINWILSTLKFAMDSNKIIDEEKFIAEFCLFHFSKRSTCVELLEILEKAGKIKIVDGKIWLPKDYEAELILQKAEEAEKTN